MPSSRSLPSVSAESTRVPVERGSASPSFGHRARTAQPQVRLRTHSGLCHAIGRTLVALTCLKAFHTGLAANSRRAVNRPVVFSSCPIALGVGPCLCRTEISRWNASSQLWRGASDDAILAAQHELVLPDTEAGFAHVSGWLPSCLPRPVRTLCAHAVLFYRVVGLFSILASALHCPLPALRLRQAPQHCRLGVVPVLPSTPFTGLHRPELHHY